MFLDIIFWDKICPWLIYRLQCVFIERNEKSFKIKLQKIAEPLNMILKYLWRYTFAFCEHVPTSSRLEKKNDIIHNPGSHHTRAFSARTEKQRWLVGASSRHALKPESSWPTCTTRRAFFRYGVCLCSSSSRHMLLLIVARHSSSTNTPAAGVTGV